MRIRDSWRSAEGRRKGLALALTLFLLPGQASAGQAGLESAGQAANGVCTALCQMLGQQSINNGNQNVQQGQSTMNQAQVAMGLMQIAQGLLGLAAAAAAAGKQKKGQQYENNLGDFGSGYVPPTFDTNTGNNGSGNSQLGEGGGATLDPAQGSSIAISTDDLRNGALGNSMTVMEKTFGIQRDDFLNALKNGADAKAILATAPKNRPSLETLNRIEQGLAAEAANDSGRALASVGGTEVNQGGGIQQGPLADASKGKELDAAAARAALAYTGSTSPEEDLEAINGLSVSPEVKAALQKKAARVKAEREMRESHSWSIFQLVHSRYRKLETMLYGRVERTNTPAPGSGF